MKRLALIVSLLLAALQAFPQVFIGCLSDGSWAEAPMLRKSFTLNSDDFVSNGFDLLNFYIDVTSLGYHEVYINGTKVDQHVMQPAVSQLDKRALRLTYDITSLLRVGENKVMIWIGQGWGRIYGTPAAVMATVYQSLSSWCQELVTEYASTDSTWEASPSGYSYTDSWQPMHFGGERYDARVKPSWRPASVYDATGITISHQEFSGNRIVGTLSPLAATPQPDGSLLLDFGRVLTGWFQACMLPLPAGDSVTMEYLDHIDAKPPFTETDVFISDGDSGCFTNRFHTHAFRYVRVRGADIIYARALQISAVDPGGGATFECSDPRLNAIHDMVKYTLSCLTFSGYMVDCPHVERMGYGGDGNSSTMALQTIWDVRDTYRNWYTSWCDAMDSTGDLPYVAPAFRTGGGPYWSGFFIMAPCRTWLNYEDTLRRCGDRYLMIEHYGQMCRWLDFVQRHCEDGILRPWPDNARRGWFLGDWLAPEGVDVGGESALHVSNCFLSECLSAMERMADAMYFYHEDVLRFASWRKSLNAAIHRHFYHPETHTYANGTPLDQCYALLMGIPPDSTIAQAVKEQLLNDIHGKYRDHIAVGLVGVPVFTEWCIRERQAGLMATILRQPDYPGYLNMIHNGATTTWESWDCGRPGKEDRSRVHNCYNGIAVWFYQALAGIRPDPNNPGYRHFFVDPQPVDGVNWIRATKPTEFGDICVEINENVLKLTVPQGASATVFPSTCDEQTVSSGTWLFEINDNTK